MPLQHHRPLAAPHPLATQLESLLTLLAEERAIYTTLAQTLETEHDALLKTDLARMNACVCSKETLALRIKGLDESRRMLARRLATALGVSVEEMTLTRLAEALPPLDGARLREAGQHLRTLAERCRDLNDANGRAAQRGADLLGAAVGFLVGQNDPAGRIYAPPTRGRSGAYPPQGAARAGLGTSSFISRQA